MNTQKIIDAEGKYLVGTYRRPEIVLARGEGMMLYDTDDRPYLDFMSGIAVVAIGHSDPEWVAAVGDQAATLTHVSNLYHTAAHVELARRLVESSFADRAYFCNSGAEANEAALKFARKWARENGKPGQQDIVAFDGSFHGRTMGALSVTYKSQYREPFEPLVPGVGFAPYNDVAAAVAIINEQTCAVIVEPLQGEGGVRPADVGFLQVLRQRCDEAGALLIFDEVQCGLGRTGTLWAYEAYGITPDIMTLAKPLANGLPIGATLVTEAVGKSIQPGDHGSTFAAGPVVCRAGQVVFDRVSQPEFLAHVTAMGQYLERQLEQLASGHIRDIRGRGLLIGIELDTEAAPLVMAARDRGLLVINAGPNVLRLAPPLIVQKDDIDAAMETLYDCFTAL